MKRTQSSPNQTPSPNRFACKATYSTRALHSSDSATFELPYPRVDLLQVIPCHTRHLLLQPRQSFAAGVPTKKLFHLRRNIAARPWLRLTASQSLVQWRHPFAQHCGTVEQILALQSFHEPGLRTLPLSESRPRTSPAHKLKTSMHWYQVCAPGAGMDHFPSLLPALLHLWELRRHLRLKPARRKQLLTKRNKKLEPKAALTSFMLWRTNGRQACRWKFQDNTVIQIDWLYISQTGKKKKLAAKKSNDCHALVTTCSRPSKTLATNYHCTHLHDPAAAQASNPYCARALQASCGFIRSTARFSWNALCTSQLCFYFLGSRCLSSTDSDKSELRD